MTYDILAIGDTVTDAFIRLKDAEVHHKRLSMRFADKIPYEDVWIVPAVGNPANAAAAAGRLGLRAAIATNVGKDVQGEEAIAAFASNNVDTSFIAVHEGMKTNYHYVLWFQDDRTILIKHEKYPRTFPDIKDEVRWIYFSSLGEDALEFHDVIADWLETHPETKLAFQPNTFQIGLTERLQRIYVCTDLFFCNRDEAQRILKSQNDDIKTLLDGIRALGPKTVVITDGHEGAYALENGEYWYMPIYPDPKPPLERTGAGDAFSSTVTAALALGLPLSEALRWGPVNSMAVVQEIGAQKGLLTREKLEEYLKNAPVDYLPKKI